MKRINKKTGAIIIGAILLILLIAGVSARYVKTDEQNDSAVAKDFYFTSDILDGGTHTITATQANGTAKLELTLMNHADDLRFSQTDIEYSVSVKENGSDTELATAAAGTNITGTIASGAGNDQKVTVTGLEPGKTYKVTATTDNIYSKTLTGTVKVNSSDSSLYGSINDKGEYIEVAVWTKDYSGSVEVAAASSLIPDNTDRYMTSAGIGSTVTVSDWKKDTSHAFRFFKNDSSKTYSLEISGKKVVVNEK